MPPDAPGYAAAQQRIAAESRERGYQTVCDADLDRFRITFQPAREALAGLPFQPVDLSATPFSRFAILGAMIERDNTARSRVYRGFRMPGGRTVTLFEHDMSVDGSSSWRNPEDEPERVNGLPARLIVLRTPAGEAVSHLSWVEHRRSYELWIDASVVDSPLRDELFAMAASLPRSVPGCPGEKPPEPVRLGADGFPDFGPVPLTLPYPGPDASSATSGRPCR
ncbi:hypothetical protein [Pseudoduganella umbonata]|uniref:Uncharacterized protein n=1 Tax=Pseudoduganella umbonata TaxID=864828 RepID=A0A4P8HMK8_9BURK|nr:hypothetical protein [Pseudoduganella umbonata]MBB3219597.1 hypothetical protein [Pseudoduganella umbonata]QCP09664.1 hypothetical protein FCL38_03930 [Pseudoduganella umbonata]